jgi:hypothetical protein
VLAGNKRRREVYEQQSSSNGTLNDNNTSMDIGLKSDEDSLIPYELDVYLTILYLAKYQCTTAFHAFFPASAKPCKGYHFWCAIGTPLPIFDRLLRDAVKRIGESKAHAGLVPIRDVSDVTLGFRCVFGHLI